jgi:hypothetical protein
MPKIGKGEERECMEERRENGMNREGEGREREEERGEGGREERRGGRERERHVRAHEGHNDIQQSGAINQAWCRAPRAEHAPPPGGAPERKSIHNSTDHLSAP